MSLFTKILSAVIAADFYYFICIIISVPLKWDEFKY